MFIIFKRHVHHLLVDELILFLLKSYLLSFHFLSFSLFCHRLLPTGFNFSKKFIGHFRFRLPWWWSFNNLLSHFKLWVHYLVVLGLIKLKFDSFTIFWFGLNLCLLNYWINGYFQILIRENILEFFEDLITFVVISKSF